MFSEFLLCRVLCPSSYYVWDDWWIYYTCRKLMNRLCNFSWINGAVDYSLRSFLELEFCEFNSSKVWHSHVSGSSFLKTSISRVFLCNMAVVQWSCHLIKLSFWYDTMTNKFFQEFWLTIWKINCKKWFFEKYFAEYQKWTACWTCSSFLFFFISSGAQPQLENAVHKFIWTRTATWSCGCSVCKCSFVGLCSFILWVNIYCVI